MPLVSRYRVKVLRTMGSHSVRNDACSRGSPPVRLITGRDGPGMTSREQKVVSARGRNGIRRLLTFVRTCRYLNIAEEQVRAFIFSLNSGRCIAVAAPDITPRKADKDMPLADPGALALNRAEDLLYAGVFHAANNTEQHHELQVKLPTKPSNTLFQL